MRLVYFLLVTILLLVQCWPKVAANLHVDHQLLSAHIQKDLAHIVIKNVDIQPLLFANQAFSVILNTVAFEGFNNLQLNGIRNSKDRQLMDFTLDELIMNMLYTINGTVGGVFRVESSGSQSIAYNDIKVSVELPLLALKSSKDENRNFANLEFSNYFIESKPIQDPYSHGIAYAIFWKTMPRLHQPLTNCIRESLIAQHPVTSKSLDS